MKQMQMYNPTHNIWIVYTRKVSKSQLPQNHLCDLQLVSDGAWYHLYLIGVGSCQSTKEWPVSNFAECTMSLLIVHLVKL